MTEDDIDAIIDDQIGPRIARYLAGECSPEDARAVRAWIETDARREEAVAKLSRVWQAAEPRRDEWNVDRAWTTFVAARARATHAAVRVTEPTALLPTPLTARDARRRPARRVAWAMRVSVAGLLVAAAIGSWQLARRSSEARGTRGTAVADTPIEYATPAGRRLTLRLADGTRVVLGVASRLRAAADFGAGARDVWLDGEALLDVVHDARRPFRVHVRGSVVEDVGTTFDVRAYPSDSSIAVIVASGRVLVRTPTMTQAGVTSRPFTVDSGSLASLSAGGAVRVDSGVDVAQHLAWSRGQLVFHDTPLRDALLQIARWYDVDVKLADSTLASRRVTASFSTESVDDVLSLVARSLGIAYEHRGRLVIVRAEQAP